MNTSPNGDAPQLSVNILTIAKARGLDTPKAIADAAGIPDTSFYRKLKRPGTFTIDELDALATALGTDAATIYTGKAA